MNSSITNINSPKTISESSELIKTSNGRTVLDIALEKNHLDLLQYLVKEKKIALSSQNSSQDQDALWKALGMILTSKSSDDGGDIDSKASTDIKESDKEESASTTSSESVAFKCAEGGVKDALNVDGCDMGESNTNFACSADNAENDHNDYLDWSSDANHKKVRRSKMQVKNESNVDDNNHKSFHEIRNSCHESTFNISLKVNEKMEKIGNQLFELIGAEYSDDESDSSQSTITCPAKVLDKKKEPLWMRRKNDVNNSNSKRAPREGGSMRPKPIDMRESQRLARLKLEQYRLKSASTDETEKSESDTEPLICNESCSIFSDFWNE